LKFIHHSLYLSFKSSYLSLRSSSLNPRCSPHLITSLCMLFSHSSFVCTILLFIPNSQTSSPQRSYLFLLSSTLFLVLLFILFNFHLVITIIIIIIIIIITNCNWTVTRCQ
jgi:hypothetical protein